MAAKIINLDAFRKASDEKEPRIEPSQSSSNADVVCLDKSWSKISRMKLDPKSIINLEILLDDVSQFFKNTQDAHDKFMDLSRDRVTKELLECARFALAKSKYFASKDLNTNISHRDARLYLAEISESFANYVELHNQTMNNIAHTHDADKPPSLQ